MWIENSDGRVKSLVALIQLFSDKPAKTLKSTASVAYHLNAVLVNVAARGRQWLIDNGPTLVGFLPASCTQKQLEEEEI